jgi:chemotaxis protein methyltransferase CheR
VFRRQDLRRRMPAGPFDLVPCRNLAFTCFDEGLQRDVLARLRRRIVPGGALVIGRHERLPGPSGFLPWPGAGGVLRRAEPTPARRPAQRRIGPGSTNS